MTYAILTFGCRVNQADSFEFEDSLRARGAVEAPAGDADLVLVNTCSVTGAADRGARHLIRRVARANARARIIVTGCYATRQPGDLASLPQVVHLVPNDAKARLAGWLRSADASRPAGPDDGAMFSGDGRLSDQEVSLTPCRQDARSAGPRAGDRVGAEEARVGPGAMGRTAIPLRVQTGCGEPCAFCVVPSTRGASRSLSAEEVCRRARRLAEAGYKEIWLVGVHLGAYGRDLPSRSSLVELLRALDRVPGDLMFRISSLEPMDCPRDLVDLVAGSGRYLPHFHLPVQHGSDRMLARMRRSCTIAFYADLVARIRARLPHASIGTDVIAGFPGEREDEADESARHIAALPLSYLHVFPYSDRPGTAAAAMTPKVSPQDARQRARRLRTLGRRFAARFANAHLGQERPGLTLADGTLVLTDNFLKVRIPPGLARNTRVRIQIDAAGPALTGRVVSSGG